MEARLTADELASDLASAEVLVDKHQEHMVRISHVFNEFLKVFPRNMNNLCAIRLG